MHVAIVLVVFLGFDSAARYNHHEEGKSVQLIAV